MMATAKTLTRSTPVTRIVSRGQGVVFEIPSPTGPKPAEFLNLGEETYCVIRGTIPAGGIVPLHRHDDPESFFVLSGEGQVLAQTESGMEWRTTRIGDFIDTCGAKHAWRNQSKSPVELLIVTTPKLGRFLRELSDLVRSGTYSLEELSNLSDAYGYWAASPQENTEVGIALR
jgi:quercetin dioxygenase-like cupin family protein